MKKTTRQQKNTCLDTGSFGSGLKIKYFSVMVFEEDGKTIFQPMVNGKDTKALEEFFQNGSLEVWLPNGAADAEGFDVSILKYRPVVQVASKQACAMAKSASRTSLRTSPLNSTHAATKPIDPHNPNSEVITKKLP
ncbi:MAG: hypothetical protein NWF04_08745 [Candidatus Bathyarchaeota archaeon]|nr:hypothetical protein [Candidatus Bathyarchaeota archaeon]